MKQPKPFVEILKQKITIGSSRSILLNAIPGKLTTRLPLSDLSCIKKSLPKDFIDELTSDAKFSIKFSVDSDLKNDDVVKQFIRIQKRLNAIKYEHDDYLKEHGVETFGFGFPLLVRKNIKDPTKYIVSPIFIFPLDIKLSFEKLRQWQIVRNSDSEIRLNEVLASYLENEEHIKIPQIPEEMLVDGVLDKSEMESFCSTLLNSFQNSNFKHTDWKNFDSIPDKIESDSKTYEKTHIIWNGVFGLYKSQKQSQIKEMEELLENYEDLPESDFEVEWENNHSPEVTDPSQNLVLRTLNNTQNIVIQGPPGTGKSQTLTAIISSGLANNKKILIVCEKRTALEVLKNNLEELIPNISQRIALIEDVVRDRGPIVEIVRNRTARYLKNIHLTSSIREDVKRFEEKSKKIEDQYNELRKPIWNNLRWKDLIYEWIKNPKDPKQQKEIFNLHKNFQKQQLSDEDFVNLNSKISDAVLLFKKTKDYYDYFQKKLIVPNNISSEFSKELHFAFREIIENLLGLEEKMISEKANVDKTLNQNIINSIQNASKYQSELLALLSNWENENINLLAPPLGIRLKAIFIKKYKQLLADSIIANGLIKNIEYEIKGWPEKILTQDIYLIQRRPILDFYDAVLKQSIAELNEFSINDISRKKSISNKFDEIYADFIINLNGAKKFIKLELESNINLSYEELKKRISSLKYNLEEFLQSESRLIDFLKWLSFESQQESFVKEWIKSLQEFNPTEWQSLLNDSWLFYKLLNEDLDDRFPTDDSTLEVLKTLHLAIQKSQKKLIQCNLESLFFDGQEKIKKSGLIINQVYNLRGSKGGTRNSLRKIIQINTEAFTNFFPVVMVNPSTCSSIIPLKSGLFDIVLFDEASQLRIEDTYPAMLKGKQIIVSGDSQQMPPSSYFENSNNLLDVDNIEDDEENDDSSEEQLIEALKKNNALNMAVSESLLQFAIDSDFRQTYLNMHYRSKHPDLIEFSNTCFYAGRLIPMPEKSASPPIIFKNVKGLYDNRQNLDEAKEVIRILKDEVSEEHSVGVATFNINQRNLILDLINDEREANEIFRSKIDLLEQNGFFVKNLENIQGDEKDVIVLSTTFGLNKENNFRMNFGPISQKNGHRLLNVIITRAKYKQYVVTSIPESKINDYRIRVETNRKIDGTTGLLAYLDYARAVSLDDKENKDNILQFIKSKISSGQKPVNNDDFGLTESPFEQEVYDWLSEVIDKERLKLQYKCGGFRIDMVVLPKDQSITKKLAIECDGAAYHSEELAWHNDIYRQQQLEENDFVFHRIWSTNWWRNPTSEFEALLKTIEKLG